MIGALPQGWPLGNCGCVAGVGADDGKIGGASHHGLPGGGSGSDPGIADGKMIGALPQGWPLDNSCRVVGGGERGAPGALVHGEIGSARG